MFLQLMIPTQSKIECIDFDVKYNEREDHAIFG